MIFGTFIELCICHHNTSLECFHHLPKFPQAHLSSIKCVFSNVVCFLYFKYLIIKSRITHCLIETWKTSTKIFCKCGLRFWIHTPLKSAHLHLFSICGFKKGNKLYSWFLPSYILGGQMSCRSGWVFSFKKYNWCMEKISNIQMSVLYGFLYSTNFWENKSHGTGWGKEWKLDYNSIKT